MPTTVALLRGMNVGGHRITNARLRELFQAMGHHEVRSYRASGNLLFDHPEVEEEELAQRISSSLKEALGYAVPTYLRPAAELRATAAQAPFRAGMLAKRGKLQVIFLPSTPSRPAANRILAQGSEEDLLALHGRQLYWLPRGGTKDSPLDLDAIYRAVGPGTIRTMGTVQGIAMKLATR